MVREEGWPRKDVCLLKLLEDRKGRTSLRNRNEQGIEEHKEVDALDNSYLDTAFLLIVFPMNCKINHARNDYEVNKNCNQWCKIIN